MKLSLQYFLTLQHVQMLVLQFYLFALLVYDVARVAVQQEPLIVDIIGGYVNTRLLSLSTMSVSFLFRALNNYWYFSIMQEFEPTGLTFIYKFMLLKFFFTIDTSVYKFVMMFWKNQSRFRRSSLNNGSIYPDLPTDEPERLVLLVEGPQFFF